jgi:hypothetical protein
MPAQRIKGQEVSILMTRGGELEAELIDIRNFTFEPKLEIKEEGYLGEKTNRHDEIFNGCRGDLELHVHSDDWIRFVQAVIERAKRNTPDVVFNMSAVLFYPNGQTPTLQAVDVKFSNFPMNASARGEYVTVKMDWACDDFTVDFG